MAHSVSDLLLFLREFRRNFHSTGALLPSSRFLARALVRYVAAGRHGPPRRILEAGPGTGAVTRRLVAAMGPADRLDLAECNEQFVSRLRKHLQIDPLLRRAADRIRLFHLPVQELARESGYDLIVCGLPFNNFSAELVEQILGALLGRLRPGGVLSFFEYMAVRRLRLLWSRGDERLRLRGIEQAMRRAFQGRRVRCDWVWLNLPPAWVHHLRVPAG